MRFGNFFFHARRFFASLDLSKRPTNFRGSCFPKFFLTKKRLLCKGMELSSFSDYEVNLMEQAASALINDIEMGKCFVLQHKRKQKSYYRRCSSSCKKEFVFKLCSDSTVDNCDVDGKKWRERRCEESSGNKKQFSIPKKKSKALKGAKKRMMAENKINFAEIDEEPMGDEGLIMVGSAEKKDFFLGSLWLVGDQKSVWKESEIKGDKAKVSKSVDYVDEERRTSKENLCFGPWPYK